MTDYGRGPGSEPWHPEDPLFGDVYDQGYQGPSGQGHPPQHPHPQQGGWQDPYATGQHQAQYPQQGYPQQQYEQPYGQQPAQGYPQGGYDGYDTGSYQTGQFSHQDPYGGQPQDPYGGGQQPDFYGQNGYPPPQQPQFRGQPQQGMGPGPAGPGHPGMGPGQGMDPNMNPGMNPNMGPGMGPGPGGMGPQGQRPDGPQGHPQEPATGPLRAAPATTGEWEPDEDDPRDHAFFSGGDDDEDDAPSDGGRRGGRSSSKGPKKRRSGCACMVVLVVLAGGIGGIGYAGYNFYESRFGPAPDYSGQGSGAVQVEIPEGSTVTTMGNILKRAGVVKSVGAFTAAAGKNPKGSYIQSGVYVLNLHMSGAAAVTMMLDPKSQNALIFPEGLRATAVYQRIDTKLGLKAGTTAKAVKGADLGLPSWAHGNVEGFLYPAKYSVEKNMKPLDLVKEMVNRTKAEYTEDDLVAGAKKVGKSPEQILIIASLVQAEAQEKGDFGKVSRVIYNRLDQDMALGFDSTINYALGRSTLDTTTKDTQLDSPYNTYRNKGLPPGAIDNPGHQAIEAALNPTDGKWLYFTSVKPGDTRFEVTAEEHNKDVAEFDKYQKEHGG